MIETSVVIKAEGLDMNARALGLCGARAMQHQHVAALAAIDIPNILENRTDHRERDRVGFDLDRLIQGRTGVAYRCRFAASRCLYLIEGVENVAPTEAS